PLLGEEGVQRRHGVDLAAAFPAGELRHQRIVSPGQRGSRTRLRRTIPNPRRRIRRVTVRTAPPSATGRITTPWPLLSDVPCPGVLPHGRATGGVTLWCPGGPATSRGQGGRTLFGFTATGTGVGAAVGRGVGLGVACGG